MTQKTASQTSDETNATPRWHELGYIGTKVDPRPNSAYTLGGETAVADTADDDSDDGEGQEGGADGK